MQCWGLSLREPMDPFGMEGGGEGRRVSRVPRGDVGASARSHLPPRRGGHQLMAAGANPGEENGLGRQMGIVPDGRRSGVGRVT